MIPFLFLNVSTHPMRDFYRVFSQFYNECLHPPDDALIRWSPSCGGWGPNSLQVLTKTPFIIVYQAYDYIDMIISCKALQWSRKNTNIGSPFCVVKVSFLLQIRSPSLFCSQFLVGNSATPLATPPPTHPATQPVKPTATPPATPSATLPATPLQHLL